MNNEPQAMDPRECKRALTNYEAMIEWQAKLAAALARLAAPPATYLLRHDGTLEEIRTLTPLAR